MLLFGSFNQRILNINPLIVTVDDFLSAQECEALIEAASGDLRRSRVVGKDGEVFESESRTNSTTVVSADQTPVVTKFLMTLGMLLRIPVSHAEEMQVLHYGAGQEFKPHHDGLFLEDGEDRAALYEQQGGQRLFSTMVYLNDVENGGTTEFPNLNLSVDPQQGRLLIFANTGAGSRFMSNLSLHAGTPVEQGEKWSAITWWRERAPGDPA
ncbi:MAG: 2OG-Fe(II) oxygenase [Pseudomonadota bacterium]